MSRTFYKKGEKKVEEKEEITLEEMTFWLRALSNYYVLGNYGLEEDSYVKDLRVALNVINNDGDPSEKQMQRSIDRLKSMIAFFERMTIGEPPLIIKKARNGEEPSGYDCGEGSCPAVMFRKHYVEVFKNIISLIEKRMV